MQYIERLPVLLALAGSLVTGILNLLCFRQQNEVLLHMLLAMVIFYIIGLFIRSTVLSIKEQIDEKRRIKEAEEKAKMEKERKEKELANEKGLDKTEEFLGKNIDLSVSDTHEDKFDPLPVSEYIKKQLKNI